MMEKSYRKHWSYTFSLIRNRRPACWLWASLMLQVFVSMEQPICSNSSQQVTYLVWTLFYGSQFKHLRERLETRVDLSYSQLALLCSSLCIHAICVCPSSSSLWMFGFVSASCFVEIQNFTSPCLRLGAHAYDVAAWYSLLVCLLKDALTFYSVYKPPSLHRPPSNILDQFSMVGYIYNSDRFFACLCSWVLIGYLCLWL